jgi:NADPH-dependent glutamate synthase beta chain and related oxidoreductases
MRCCAAATPGRSPADGGDRRITHSASLTEGSQTEGRRRGVAIAVAIVGAGPAGFYTVEALLDRAEAVSIDILERLPTPYGLVRAGVAPDHQSTKQVVRKFEQTALTRMVHFYGNVEVGRDVTIDELLAAYDAVVIAAGSPNDRMLGIPGEHLAGVYGSSAFVGWYNGHPDFRDLEPRLASTAVVVGNGNVALDVARVLVKTRAEMAASDIPDYALEDIARADVRTVHVLGRRGPADTHFAPAEMRELTRLADCAPSVDPADLPPAEADDDKVLALLRRFAGQPAGDHKRRLNFRFLLAPEEILGDTQVEGLRCRRTRVEDGRVVTTDEVVDLACGTVVTAIGYRASPIPGVPFDDKLGRMQSDDGRVAPGLYAVGWAKRGPTGVIGSNKPDGIQCAEQILGDLDLGAASGDRPGRQALERLLDVRHIRFVTLDDWRRIDLEEVARADQPAPRRKFTSFAEMLAVVGVTHRHRLG